MTDHKELRRLAEAATPGPWAMRQGSPSMNGENFTIRRSDAPGIRISGFAYGFGSGDPEFIAAANPATILALLDEVESLRARAQAAEAVIAEALEPRNIGYGHIDQVAKERDEARAVSWSRADAEFVLDQLIDAGEIDQPTPNEYRAIIDRAMRSHYWRGRYWPSLSDCVGGDWDAIREAVREGIGA